MLQQMSGFPSFLRSNNSLLYILIYPLIYPFHLLIDTWVVSTFWPLGIGLLWAFTCMYLFDHLFLVLLSKHLGVKLMYHVVIVYLAYLEILNIPFIMLKMLYNTYRQILLLVLQLKTPFFLIPRANWSAVLLNSTFYKPFHLNCQTLSISYLYNC